MLRRVLARAGGTGGAHLAQVPRNEARRVAVLAVAALGVVFGDIGTSPLYALREAFHGHFGIEPTAENVLGVLSLIFWALLLVVSVKYLAFILRADNRGEGGILALMALVHPEHSARRTSRVRTRMILILLALFGAALLYGDGMITPAISVLSAVEGLNVATHVFEPYVIPITIGILAGVFLIQRHGTAGIGAVFGPITFVWFVTLAALGVRGILLAPQVLQAVNPLHGVLFFVHNGWFGFLVLGAVFLVVTGSEALYADMGHFGRRPIRMTWFAVVLPALVLNYFGQGALVLSSPETVVNPFYLLAPRWALYPLVILATLATIIASQAMISGAFSITMQGIHLGYIPRLRIEHTSHTERGQIYIPEVNWMLAISTVGLVLGFRTSSNLAAAYGIAVVTTMVITATLFTVVAREVLGWSALKTFGIMGGLVLVDLAFLSANAIKIPQGGWFPLIVGVAIFTLMTTWRRGRKILSDRVRKNKMPVDRFIEGVRSRPPLRVPGTAVFLTGNPDATPPALLHNLRHNKILHQQVAILSVRTEDVSRVLHPERVEVDDLGEGFWRIVARYGFMEEPNVPEVMALARGRGFEFDGDDTTFFLGRERIIAAHEPGGMAFWREKLFAVMARNAQQATAFFRIPPERVVEVGAQIKM